VYFALALAFFLSMLAIVLAQYKLQTFFYTRTSAQPKLPADLNVWWKVHSYVGPITAIIGPLIVVQIVTVFAKHGRFDTFLFHTSLLGALIACWYYLLITYRSPAIFSQRLLFSVFVAGVFVGTVLLIHRIFSANSSGGLSRNFASSMRTLILFGLAYIAGEQVKNPTWRKVWTIWVIPFGTLVLLGSMSASFEGDVAVWLSAAAGAAVVGWLAAWARWSTVDLDLSAKGWLSRRPSTIILYLALALFAGIGVVLYSDFAASATHQAQRLLIQGRMPTNPLLSNLIYPAALKPLHGDPLGLCVPQATFLLLGRQGENFYILLRPSRDNVALGQAEVIRLNGGDYSVGTGFNDPGSCSSR
jgi:hypothetical protein